MQPAPASWSLEGDSSMISAAKITDKTGCRVSRIEVTTAGRRGSELEISSQPSDLRRQREQDEPAGRGHGGREIEIADHGSDRRAEDRRGERRREERPGRPAKILASLAQDEQEAGVRDAGQNAVDRTEPRIRSVCALLERAGDEDDAEAHDRNRRQRRALRPLAEQRPREQPDEHDLELPSTVASPAPTNSIALCHRTRSAAKNAPASHASENGAPITRPVAAILDPGEHEKRRQRPHAAVERAGRRGHV